MNRKRMKINIKLYKHQDEGTLSLVDKGVGEIYDPETKGSLRAISTIGSHVTLKVGKYRVQLDRETFIKFAKQILFKYERI